jgi:thioredoxin-like negative regulator of GroEL
METLDMTLYKFYASWCKPCKALGEVMSKVTHDIPVVDVDIEHDRKAALVYAVRSVPTLILVDENGGIIRRGLGVMTEEQFKQFIEG